MQLEQIAQNPGRLILYTLLLTLALVVGLSLGQGLGFQILTIALLFTLGWLVFFLAQPVTALVVIICVKAFADRWNFPIVGAFTVNALLYCVLLGGGFIYFALNYARMKQNAASRVYLCFVLYCLPLTLVAPDRINGLAAWLREAAMWMLYFLTANLVTDQSGQRKYIKLLIIVGLVGVGVSLLQQVGLYPYAWGNFGRSSGTFGHPNFFAYFLLLPISVACSFLMLARSWRTRILCIAFLAAAAVGLVLTFTRGAWIAAAVMFAALGLLGRKWFLFLAAATMLTVYTTSTLVQQRLFWLTEKPNLSAATAGRVDIWEASLPLIKERPLTGHGLNSFITYSPFRTDAHNSYLKVLFEAGAIGLAIYCLFLLIVLGHAFRVWRRTADPFQRCLALAIGSFLIAFLVGGLWENLFLGQGTQWFSYSAAAIMTASSRRLQQKSADQPTQALAVAR